MLSAALLAFLVTTTGSSVHAAADPATPNAPAESAPAEPTAEESLATRQEQLAARYRRFEETLLQLSEYLRRTDPQRAELLVRALGRGKEGRLHEQFERLTDLLKSEQLGDAIERQEEMLRQLANLLDLLQSEDRKDELEREKARIKELIKEVTQLIHKESDVRGATERREPAEKLQQQQSKIAEATQRLAEKIDQQDREKNSKFARPPKAGDGSKPKPPEGKDPANPENESPTGDPAPSESEPGKNSETGKPEGGESPAKPADGDPMPSDGGDQSPPGEKPPMPSSGQSDPSAKPKQSTPGRAELEQAQQQMQRAIEELKQKQLDQASEEQERALRELIKAKERLEEILRQLREEERELMLVALESRLRDLLARETQIHQATVALHQIPEDQRTDRHQTRATELSRQQEEVALLTGKALNLLKEEGSSVAFPESLQQVRGDMRQVARRLAQADVAELTQGIEKDIIESLEELLESLQRELKKAQEKKQQPSQSQPSQPQDASLIEQLAELKLLRNLQQRINRRTKSIGKMVEGEQATRDDLLEQLRDLSFRQSRIQQAANQLATKKNQ